MRFSIALASLAFTAAAQSTATLSPAPKATQASGVSGALDPAFAGFGIEPSNLYSFTGGTTTNELSVNLLANLGNYSGIPPQLRIGGNTADNMIYDASYNQYNIQTNPNPTGQGNVPSDLYTFGPTYWTALDRFPVNTPITFGLNLAYEASDYLTQIVSEASSCLNGLSNVKLYSFEIGNEPDLYLENTFRSGSWGGQVYTQEWLTRASAVYSQVLQPAGIASNFFEGPATASTIGTTFEIDMLIQDGMLQGQNGSGTLLAGWNQHDYFYYVGVSPYDLTLDLLMELSNTEVQFKYWVSEVDEALNSSLPYFLREMASAGPIGLPGISDTFGAALWTLNFLCYAASVGVSSVQMHMTDDSYAAAWAPIEMYGQGPHVRPSYYAHAAMAMLIGSGNGTTQIAALPISNVPSDYTNNVRCYAAYTNGALSAVVIINSQLSNASNPSPGSLSFALNLGSAYKSQTLYLSTLTNDGADSQNGTTWQGISYEESGNGKPTILSNKPNTTQLGESGNAVINVRDSQAVIANIGYELGSHQVLVNGTIPPTSKKSSASSTASGSATAVVASLTTTAIALATTGSASASGHRSSGSHSHSAKEIGGRGLGPIWITAFAVGVAFAALHILALR